MVAEVLRQSNELTKYLLSFWQWEVKDLKTLLFGEWGSRAWYQVSNIFNLLETESCLCWVGCDSLFTKPYQYLASIIEVFIINRSMYQYIVYIYLAYACDIARQYFIGHTTLKERAWTLETHGYSVPFKQSLLSDENRVFLRIRVQRCLTSIMPKTLGFRVPILLIICWMLGMDHPSSPLVAEFNRTKSRVKRHFWGWPSGVGLGTRWAWLHSVARESLMTLGPKLHQLASVSLSATLPNACEAVHDYMGVATYLHLSQSSLVQPLPVPYGPSWRILLICPATLPSGCVLILAQVPRPIASHAMEIVRPRSIILATIRWKVLPFVRRDTTGSGATHSSTLHLELLHRCTVAKLTISLDQFIQVSLKGYVGIWISMWVFAMSERLVQAPQDALIQVAWNGTYGRCSATPLMNSIPAYLLHIVQLDPDPANGVVNHLLPSQSQFQVLMLGLEGVQLF
jgi:hypothetical protein